jgi:hypothetical protein
MNPGGLPIVDLMGWLNSGGTRAQPFDQSLLGPIFGPPRAAPAVPRAAPRPQERRPTLYDISGNLTSGPGYSSLQAIRGGSR